MCYKRVPRFIILVDRNSYGCHSRSPNSSIRFTQDDKRNKTRSPPLLISLFPLSPIHWPPLSTSIFLSADRNVRTVSLPWLQYLMQRKNDGTSPTSEPRFWIFSVSREGKSPSLQEYFHCFAKGHPPYQWGFPIQRKICQQRQFTSDEGLRQYWVEMRLLLFWSASRSMQRQRSRSSVIRRISVENMRSS